MSGDVIPLEGLDRAAVLAALYAGASPGGAQSMGWMQWSPGGLTLEQARELLARGTDFDYVSGRALKVDLGGAALDPWLYDREYGAGAARRALTAHGILP
ncbi:hypothetical protein [Deinococcus kurensis]|uniref:hypothetical protein n=1 Tax=Deinococcus kurensis TaxID=2662757 RepID=UPI0012D36B20|nr:hypothetical protein [Deinococcus kurensis]